MSLLKTLVAAAVGTLAVTASALGVAPANTAPPSIPSPRAYLENTATAGTWSNSPDTITDQWQVSTGPDSSGTWTDATGTGNATLTYTPTQGDAGKYLRLKETATNIDGAVDAYSAVQYVTRPDVLFSRNVGATGTSGVSVFPVLPATSALLAGVAGGDASNVTNLQFPVPDPTGAFMFMGDDGGGIWRFPVKPDGTLGAGIPAAACGTGGIVRFGVITPDAQYAYFVNNSSSAVCQYSYSAAAGTLTPLGTPSVPLANCGNTQNIVLSPTQSAAYVACRDGGVAGLSIGVDGALTALTGSPFGQGDNVKPTFIAITPDGKNIYATQYDSGQWVRTFAVTAGVPTYDSGASFPFSGANGVLALSDTVVYVENFDSPYITGYTRDPATGMLSIIGTAVNTSTNGGPNPPCCSMASSPDAAALYVGSYGLSVVGQFDIGSGGVLSPLSPYTRTASSPNPAWIAYSRPTPSVAVFSAPASPVTQATSTLTYTLDLAEPSSGVTAADFTVGGTSPGWSVQSVTGSGAGPYTITLTGGTGDGTVTLSLAANAATGVNSITGPAGAAAAPVVTVDSPPTPTWTSVPTTPVPFASSSPLNYTVTFNKSVHGLSSSSFTNTGTATGCVITTPVTSGQTVTSAAIAVTGCSPGTVILTLAANAAVDAGSATGPAAPSSAASVTILQAATPTISIKSAAVAKATTLTTVINPSAAGAVTVTATLNGVTVCTASGTALAAGRKTMTCSLSEPARLAIRTKGATLIVTAQLTVGGVTVSASKTLKVARCVEKKSSSRS